MYFKLMRNSLMRAILILSSVLFPVTYAAPVPESHILIAYFSRVGNTPFADDVDAASGASILVRDGKIVGNTAYIAEINHKLTDGELYLIQTAQLYPADFDVLREQNHRQQDEETMPALVNLPPNLDGYDTIFVGYPNWAMHVPRPVISFLSAFDFSGKTVIPFCTHGGFGGSMTFPVVGLSAHGAKLGPGLTINDDDVLTADDDVATWIESLELTTP